MPGDFDINFLLRQFLNIECISVKRETSNEYFPRFFHQNENNKSKITVSQTSDTTSFTGFELKTPENRERPCDGLLAGSIFDCGFIIFC